MREINGDLCHIMLAQKAQGKLSFQENNEYQTWKEEIRQKLCVLIGIDNVKANVCDLNVQIESQEKKDGYMQTRFIFESETGAIVPCYLLVPTKEKKKYPVAIVLQGHASGAHLSLGEKKWEVDEEYQPCYAMGLQAVENGFAALVLEQRYMGERRSPESYGKGAPYFGRPHMCAMGALTAFNLGRTVVAERVWDISRALDALKNFEGLDLEKIMITGHSGGGTAAYYAACLDERVGYVAPSCSFCSYKASVMMIEHCACNYIPGVCEWFEMEDLACLIAPRPMTVIAGSLDPIFPIEGVRASYEIAEKIYKKAGAAEKCRLVVTENEHHWRSDVVWSVFKEETKKLGW